jgi:hypothetical protein
MNARELIPDAFRTTVQRLPSGSVVITQSGDAGDQTVIVPPQYIKVFCDGVYQASKEARNYDDEMALAYANFCNATGKI